MPIHIYIYICTYRKSSLWFISVLVPYWITFWYYTKLICLKYKWQFPSQIVEQLFETAEPILTKRSLLNATFYFCWYVYIYAYRNSYLYVLWMCIYIHMYAYTHIWKHIYIYVYRCIRIYTQMWIGICNCIYTYIHVYVYVCMNMYIYIFMYVYTYIHKHVCICTCVYAYIT